MIETETVLILGAGSSMDIGFPSGEELYKGIYEKVLGKTNGYQRICDDQVRPPNTFRTKKWEVPNVNLLWNVLELAGRTQDDKFSYSEDYIKQFATDLWKAQPVSIDEFLFTRSEYALIGKLLILFCLSACETETTLNPSVNHTGEYTYPRLSWYRYLWQRLTDGIDKNYERLKENKLKIITFNYDRSLEEFLYRAIQGKFGLNPGEAGQLLVDSIEIHHVYGDLGVPSYIFNSTRCEKKRLSLKDPHAPLSGEYKPIPFSMLLNLCQPPGMYGETPQDLQDHGELKKKRQIELAKDIINRAERIKIYAEESSKDNTTAYKEILSWAKQIYFLGFAFHQQNLKVLGLEPSLFKDTASSIIACGYGLTEEEAAQKQKYIKFLKGQGGVRIVHTWPGLPLLRKEESVLVSFFRNVPRATLL